MNEFSANALREKFVIGEADDLERPPLIALANRFELDLRDDRGQLVERIVVRGQVLHAVVRMAASLLNTFERTGPLLHRQVPLHWDQLWEKAAGPYEYHHNADLWVAVYHDGVPVFDKGVRHPLLDIIEKCALQGPTYDDSLKVAEGLFSQAGGRPTAINHDSGIAATFNVTPRQGKTGVILRGARRTTVFVVHGDRREGGEAQVNPVHFINTAAAYLEGIQLAFLIGQGNERTRRGQINLSSPEGLALKAARGRLAEMNAAVRTFENLYDVRYRPERPEFSQLVIAAEEVTRKRLESIE